MLGIILDIADIVLNVVLIALVVKLFKDGSRFKCDDE